jgi:hypothetical protein
MRSSMKVTPDVLMDVGFVIVGATLIGLAFLLG